MSSYDNHTAKLLMLCSNLCYEQFARAQKDPDYDGNISVLPSFDQLPAGYTQTATLKAPEFSFSRGSAFLKTVQNVSSFDVTDKEALDRLASGVREVYFGFILKSENQNILAFRGTQTAEEWLIDFTAVQVPVPLGWFDSKYHFKKAKMHLGFLIQYAFLYEQVNTGVGSLDHRLPLFVTGHSLGAALAVVGATVVRVLNYPIEGFLGNVRMYNFAGPRVGNDAFVEAYNFLVSDSYRIVNMADIVPVLPPSSLHLGKIRLQYGHVGTEASYLWQRGDVSANHSASDNYTPAVAEQVPTDTPPMPPAPVSGR